VEDVAREALAEMRLLIHELRPPVLAEEGLAAALQARLQAVESRSGVQIAFREEPVAETEPQRLPTTIEQGLYRIGQEALNNALKHARADRITVCLRFASKLVSLEIEDNGNGFAPEAAAGSGGVGLTGMAQRASEMGGVLTKDSAEDRGTRICVEVPL
jgi:signal transduction histidine kinase